MILFYILFQYHSLLITYSHSITARDQTIRIWNYETNKVELVRKFQVDVVLVELTSTGLMAAIAFTDQLRITQIFMDELNVSL